MYLPGLLARRLTFPRAPVPPTAAPEFCGGAAGSLTTEYELDLLLDEAGGEEEAAPSRVYSGPDTECTVSALLPGRPYQLLVSR